MLEHGRSGTPVKTHFMSCGISDVSMDDVKVFDRASNQSLLLALEAIHIRRRRPMINIKDEYRSHQLNYVF